MPTLTYERLRNAVGGWAVGLRARTELEPMGGAGDKLAPPTYGATGPGQTRYALEQRRVEGALVEAVVLDSVASQANRMELALLDAYRRGELRLPMVSVDFRDLGLAGLERLSHLEASHRIFDAALRDSLHEGMLFRLSEPGRRMTEATPRDAAALFHFSPTTLLFGGWDSTGPRGGLGSKYERAITSEVVALGVTPGVTTASRIDPLAVELGAGPLYEAGARSPNQPDWTLSPEEAEQDKGKPVKFPRTDKGREAGRPSQANFGNVMPSTDALAGGITADRIVATVVLSFAALRKLRFPREPFGEPISDERRRDAEGAAWAALAALGIAAVVLATEEGFDLRSRCVLRSLGPLRFELLGRDGGEPEQLEVDRETALALVTSGREAAASAGLTWLEDELLLQPSGRLVDLIHRSQDLARRGDADGSGD